MSDGRHDRCRIAGSQETRPAWPRIPVVTYVNSTAEVKALTTVCCTSANVIKVVNSLAEKEILLAPDRNLAKYAASRTTKTIHVWDGYCPIHDD